MEPRERGEIEAVDRGLAVCLGVAGFAVLATGLTWQLPEAVAVVGGLRVLDGDVPYRDFWTMYAPGEFYAVAALFALFGREVLVQAVAAIAVNAAAASVFFVILLRVGSGRLLAFAMTAVFALAAWTPAPELGSYPPARLLLLVGWERVLRYFASGGRGRLVAAGLAFGAAGWFKHDVAAYAAAGTGAALILAWWLAGARRPAIWLKPHRSLLWLGAGCAALVLPAVAWVAWVAGEHAWRDLIVFPATDFPLVREERFPALIPDLAPLFAWLEDPGDLREGLAAASRLKDWILCGVPELLFVGGVVALVLRHPVLRPRTLAAALLFMVCLPLYWAAAHVQKNTHLFTMAMLSASLIALAWAELPKWPAPGRGLRAALTFGGAVYAVGAVVIPASHAFWMLKSWEDGNALELRGVRGVRLPESEYRVFSLLGRFVRERVPSNEEIYVGVWRHDAIVITNLRLLLVTGRRNAVAYHELHPGVTDRPGVQQEIIETLEKKRVRCVVLWKFNWADERLDRIVEARRKKIPESGAKRLDHYIRSRFEPVAEYGEYVVMWRKGTPRPGVAVPPEGSVPGSEVAVVGT